MTLFATYRARLTFGITLVAALILTILVLFNAYDEQETLTRQQNETGLTLTRNIIYASGNLILTRNYIGLQEILTASVEYPRLSEAMATDLRGQVIAHTDPNLLGKYLSMESLVPTEDSHNVFVLPIIAAGVKLGWVRLVMNDQEMDRVFSSVIRRSFGVGIFALMLIGLISHWSLGLLFRRLQIIEHTTQSVASGNRDARTGLTGDDEIGQIAKQFDQMLNDLEVSEQENVSLLASIPDGLIVVDGDGRVVKVNDGCCSIFGYSAEEIVGQLVEILLPEDVRATHPSKRKAFMEAPDKVLKRQMDFRGRRKDGSEFPVMLSFNKVATAQSNWVICTIRDISEAQRQSAALVLAKGQAETARARLLSAAKAAHIGLWLWDIERNTLVWDRGMFDLYGIPELATEQPVDYSLWSSRVYPEDIAQAEQKLQQLIGGTGEYDPEFRIVLPSGAIRFIQGSAFLERDAEGRPRSMIGLNQDVTPLRESQNQLQIALQRAESANLAKSNFLSTMSHEIRTPLNAIIGTSYLLGLENLTDKQREDVSTIAASSKNLLGLINDILDFSKIEAGELYLEACPFLLSETLADIRTMFSTLAAQKGLGLAINEPPQGIARVLSGDSNRLKQILINLLNNAIKFTAAGEVRLGISTLDSSDERVFLRFTVNDTGIGISEEAQTRLFSPFVQAESSTNRKYGGTGLGLSIVKRLAEAMGGTVSVSSQEGHGSTFTVDLPFAASDASLTSRSTSDAAVSPLHVLVAEDDPTERQVLMRACTDFSWDVEGVDNGMAMVELVMQRLAEQKPIDCIVLDWRMPQLDGLAALTELKQRLGTTPMPSVIMITAADRTALKNALTNIHPDAVLTKPVSPSTLFNSVNHAVVAHSHDLSHVLNATLIEGGRVRWLDNTRILVVDDSQMNLEVIRRILNVEGAEAIVCDSGQRALDALSQGTAVDLVLMDMQMPDMDGCETTLNIRQRFSTELPVIALTAGATTTEKDRAMASGMDGFLTKPVDPVSLVRVLREHIERVRGTPLAAQAAAHSVPQTPAANPVPQENTWPSIAGIDSELAETMMGGDVEFFREILSKFVSEHQHTLGKVKTLLQSGQRETAAQLIHKLAGQAGNIGATSLHEAAKSVELAILDDMNELSGKMDDLERAHREIF